MSSPFRRRLRMGLQTLLGPAVGLRRQGFFIPYRYADTVAAAQPVYAALEQCFDAAAEAMRAVLAAADGLERKSVVSGKSVSVRVDLGGSRIIKKKRTTKTTTTSTTSERRVE